MYYEVYVDILFLENLWMDAELLVLTAKLLERKIHKGRILTASLLGSLGACFLIIESSWIPGGVYFCGSLLLSMLMTAVAFGVRGRFCLAVMSLYLEGFLAGGLLRYVDQFCHLNGMYILIAESTAGGMLYWMESRVRRQRKRNSQMYHATLICGNCHLELEGFLDTGNGLFDPVSRSPVNLLDHVHMEMLLKESKAEQIPRMIPYRTIAQKGILTAYRIDSMRLCQDAGSDIWEIQKPLIAVMPQTSADYDLILHRDLLSS